MIREFSTDGQTLIAGAVLSATHLGPDAARRELRVRELLAGGSTIANSALSHEKHSFRGSMRRLDRNITTRRRYLSRAPGGRDLEPGSMSCFDGQVAAPSLAVHTSKAAVGELIRVTRPTAGLDR